MPAKYQSDSWEYRKGRYATDPEQYARKLAYQKRWYAANKARLAAQGKAYRVAHKEKISAQRKAAFLRNRETHRARRKEQYRKRRELAIKEAYDWQVANRERYNANKRKNYHKPGSSRKAKNRQYSQTRIRSGKSKAWGRIYMRRKRSAVTEQYCRELLAKHSTLPANKFPLELVQLKQAQIKLKNATNEKCNPATQ